MANRKLANRYAKSLLELAEEQNKLEQVYKDMVLFNTTVQKNRSLKLFLQSPIINPDKKKNVLTKTFQGRVNDLVISFFDIVVRKKRENLLEDIGLAFIDQYNKKNKIISAELITAVEVDDKYKEEIKDALLKATAQNKVDLETTVNPNIIGGFVLKYENNLYDASISNKLRQIEKQFSDKSYNKQV